MTTRNITVAALGLLLLTAGCRNRQDGERSVGSLFRRGPSAEKSYSPTWQAQQNMVSAVYPEGTADPGMPGGMAVQPQPVAQNSLAPASVNGILQRAHEAAAAGRIDAARNDYQQVLQVDPNHAVAHHRLAVIADNQGDFSNAEKHYRMALANAPADPQTQAELYSDLGYSYLLQGRYRESEVHLQRALEFSPTYSTALNNLGLLYGKQGNYDQAQAMFRRSGASESDVDANLRELFPAGPPSGSQAYARLNQSGFPQGTPGMPANTQQANSNSLLNPGVGAITPSAASYPQDQFGSPLGNPNPGGLQTQPTGHLGHLSAGQPGGFAAGQPGGMSTGQPGGFAAGQPSGLSAGQPSGLSVGQPGGLSTGQLDGLTAFPTGDTSYDSRVRNQQAWNTQQNPSHGGFGSATPAGPAFGAGQLDRSGQPSGQPDAAWSNQTQPHAVGNSGVSQGGGLGPALGPGFPSSSGQPAGGLRSQSQGFPSNSNAIPSAPNYGGNEPQLPEVQPHGNPAYPGGAGNGFPGAGVAPQPGFGMAPTNPNLGGGSADPSSQWVNSPDPVQHAGYEAQPSSGVPALGQVPDAALWAGMNAGGPLPAVGSSLDVERRHPGSDARLGVQYPQPQRRWSSDYGIGGGQQQPVDPAANTRGNLGSPGTNQPVAGGFLRQPPAAGIGDQALREFEDELRRANEGVNQNLRHAQGQRDHLMNTPTPSVPSARY